MEGGAGDDGGGAPPPTGRLGRMREGTGEKRQKKVGKREPGKSLGTHIDLSQGIYYILMKSI